MIREQEREKKDKSFLKTTFENAKGTLGSPKKDKSSILGPKPITSSTKQVMQGDG